jgi:hypothetical protein
VKHALLVGITIAVVWCGFLLVGALIRLATDQAEGTATVPGVILFAAVIAGLVWIARDLLRRGGNGGPISH